MGKYNHQFLLTERKSDAVKLQSGDISANINFLSERLIRVSVYPENVFLLPTYSVAPDGHMPREGRPRLSLDGFPGFEPESNGDYIYRWNGYRLEIEPCNLLLSLRRETGGNKDEILLADRGPLAANLGGEFGTGQRHYLRREAGEQIFGLGDKSGRMNKSGRSFRMDCCDAMGYDAENSDPLYKHIPFYICKNNAGYVGLFYDTHAPCSVDFGREISNYTGPYRSFSVDEDALVYYILLGSLPEIVTGFSQLTGGMALPPKRSLLFAGSTMSYTDAPDSDRLLREFADECVKRKFSCGGFYMSSGYTSIGERRYVFNWNREKIPEPKSLSAFFRDRGMDLIANIKPVFLTDHPLYEEIAEEGWFLKYPDGRPALTPFWDGYGSWLDFTNPGAYVFWKGKVRSELLDNGISCTWNDNNEYEISDESIIAYGFGNPVPAYKMKPVFPLLMSMASREAQEESASGLQFVSSRSGCAGLSRVAATWSGDNMTEWKTLRYNHYMGLTMSLSGLFNFGHDIGGFSGNAPESELFLRWLQHGVFTPRFVIHSWNDDGDATTPWYYPEAEDAVRSIFAFRQKILPYLYDAFFRAHSCNQPILRPLFYKYPEADVESDLFLVSDSLLAACVYDSDVSELSVSLPGEPGGWYNESGWYEGGAEVIISVPAEAPPACFFRGGSITIEDSSEYGSCSSDEYLLCVYAGKAGSVKRSFFIDEETAIDVKAIFKSTAVEVDFKITGNLPVNPGVKLYDKEKRQLVINL